jgi:excisionase family DNA binding protein
MQTAPDWISVPVAAEMLGCTDVWVIKMINQKKLKAFRLSGRAWAISRESALDNLKEYLERDPSKPGRKREK